PARKPTQAPHPKRIFPKLRIRERARGDRTYVFEAWGRYALGEAPALACARDEYGEHRAAGAVPLWRRIKSRRGQESRVDRSSLLSLRCNSGNGGRVETRVIGRPPEHRKPGGLLRGVWIDTEQQATS